MARRCKRRKPESFGLERYVVLLTRCHTGTRLTSVNPAQHERRACCRRPNAWYDAADCPRRRSDTVTLDGWPFGPDSIRYPESDQMGGRMR